jgi:hypothetical protein
MQLPPLFPPILGPFRPLLREPPPFRDRTREPPGPQNPHSQI